MSVNVDATGLGNFEIIVRTATIDPPSMISDLIGRVSDVAVSDVAIGDAILAIPPYDMVNVLYQASAVSDGVLDVSFHNAGTDTTNHPPGTWTFLIIKLGSA